MLGSRNIKIFAALMMSMTVGAAVLMAMRVSPVDAPKPLTVLNETDNAIAKVVHQTDVPVQTAKWTNIIVHTSKESRNLTSQCHFTVQAKPTPAGFVGASDFWRNQSEGRHAFVPGYDYNSNSIGIYLEGDFSRTAPSQEQYTALVNLVQYLQDRLNIKAANVYLYGQLVPGYTLNRAFENDFSAHLLTITDR